MHGLLLYVDKAKQTFQIGPHYGIHLHLVLGHQREQQKPSKDQGRPSSLRNAKRMNLASINQSIEYISGISNTYIQVRPNPTHMKINARQNLQGDPKKMYDSVLKLKSGPEVGFYFPACVLDSEFRA